MKIDNSKAKLLLHSCCAPCLAGCIEPLARNYNFVVFWYNPNIFPKTEHDKRFSELKRLCDINNLEIIADNYNFDKEHKLWLEYIKGLESEPEKGERCKKCFEFRLKNAKEKFGGNIATTLTVSRHKNSDQIKEVEKLLGEDNFIFIDFKKYDAEKMSKEITEKYNIYRQKYCGCEFSFRN